MYIEKETSTPCRGVNNVANQQLSNTARATWSQVAIAIRLKLARATWLAWASQAPSSVNYQSANVSQRTFQESHNNIARKDKDTQNI